MTLTADPPGLWHLALSVSALTLLPVAHGSVGDTPQPVFHPHCPDLVMPCLLGQLLIKRRDAAQGGFMTASNLPPGVGRG